MALLLVLVAVMVATTVSYSFVASQSTTLSITKNVENLSKARYIAESGMHLAISYVKSTTSWRTDQSDGTWVASQAFAGGTYTIVGEDGADTNGDDVITAPGEGDDDLSDDQSDLLTLTVTGRYNGASHTVRSLITPQPGSSIAVLLVVSNETSPEADDAARKAQMEAWGFTVTLIDQTSTQTQIDAAVANVDVAYISETVVSTTLGTKFRDVPIGVVCEEVALTDEMAISSSRSNPWGTQIDIVDNTHEITSPFPLGPLTVMTANTRLNMVTGTIGAAVQTLGEQVGSSTRGLVAVETGGALVGGVSAAGRRVMLPWGVTAYNDFSNLSADGLTLTKRSIEWAAGGRPVLQYDFEEQSGTTVTDRYGSVNLSFITGNGAITWVDDVDGGTGIYFNQDAQSGTAAARTTGPSVADGLKTILQASKAFTIQAVVKIEGVDNSGGRVLTYSRDTGSSTRNFALMAGYSGSAANDDLIGRVKDTSGNATQYRQDDVMTLGTLQTLAFTVDLNLSSNNIKMYVDGALVHTSSRSGGHFNNWTSEDMILGNEDTLDRPLRGRIYDVKIWPAALSASQLQQNASQTPPPAAGGSPGSAITYRVGWLD